MLFISAACFIITEFAPKNSELPLQKKEATPEIDRKGQVDENAGSTALAPLQPPSEQPASVPAPVMAPSTPSTPSRLCRVQFVNEFCVTETVHGIQRMWPHDPSSCGGRFDIEVMLPTNYTQNADVFMVHFRDKFDRNKLPRPNSDSSINVLWGMENAAFSNTLKDANTLKLFDYIANSNAQTASIPLYTFLLPPTTGHRTPSFQGRPNFAMFAWSHCEPVRTEYARRMIYYTATTYNNLKVASMGNCLNNDKTTLPEIEAKNICPIYVNSTNWDPIRMEHNTKCDRRASPDMAARSYKFSMVFQNADCDSWIDFRLTTAFSSGSIVVFMGTKKTFLKELLPPALIDAMMFAEDYANPEALVDAMAAVNEAEFERRVGWTKGYTRDVWDKALHDGSEANLCKLCRLRFDDGTLSDGYKPPRNAIQPDPCEMRQKSDWLS